MQIMENFNTWKLLAGRSVLGAHESQTPLAKNPRDPKPAPGGETLATAPPPPMAPPAVEVRCAGCGETLEVDHGTTEFACPDCATAQRLPPELMPPPRPRRAIPLSPAGAAQDRVPCGGCGAVLTVPPGLKSFGCPVCGAAARRPQASSSPDRLPAAHPVPPGQEVLEDPLSQATHSGLVHVERYKMPIRSEQSQGWRPNHLVYRDESLSSFRADKSVPIHGGRAHEKSYNPLVHAEDSHIEPRHETTTRPSKKKSRIQSSRVEKVHVDCPSQAIPVLQIQRGSSDYSDNANQSQGRSPSDTIGRHDKRKTTVAPRIIGKELIEPPNQAAHEQQAHGTSSDRVHADQVQVEPGSKTGAWNQKRKRSSQSAAGNRKTTGLMNSSREGLQLRRSNRLAKKPTVPMDAEPIQLLNSSPNENQSVHRDITRIIANMTPNLPPQQQVPQASYNEFDDVDASTLPSSFNHGTLHAECITNRYSPSSNSWCEHEMPQEGSYGADVQPIPLQTPSQVTNGQQAHILSSGENNLEQVDVERHRKSIAVRGRHKKMGLKSSSNEAELLGVSSVSGTHQQMTLAASCRRLAASMPVMTTTLAPTGALASVLEGDNPSLLPYEPSAVVPTQLQDAAQPDIPSGSVCPSSKKRKVRGQSSKKRKVRGQSSKRHKGCDPSKFVQPCIEADSHSRSVNPTQELGGPTEPSIANPRNEGQYDDSEYGGEGDEEIVNVTRWGSRGVASLPDVPLDEEQKPTLTPVGDTMWLVHPLDKNTRLPNGVIGCIVRDRYPGMVKYKGTDQHAENWKHYAVAPDPLGEKENLLERINADFWARYRWKDGFEAHAQRVVKNVIKKEIQQMIYGARILAVLNYFKKFRGMKIGEQEARVKYLSQEEYMQVMPSWMQTCPDAWESLAWKWSSEIWKKRSMDSRRRRNMNRQPGHRQGSSSLLRLCQKKGEEEGRDVTPIEGFLYGHRNEDSSNPSNLCNDLASQRLEAYKEAVLEIHGPGYDWINNPIDSEAVYTVCGGKPHGRWLIFDGLVDTKEALADAKSQGLQVRARQAKQQGAVEERLSQLLEEKLQQIEEHRLARDQEMKQQMRQELQEQVAAAIQSTNEYWLSYLQNNAQQTGANVSLPPPPLPLPSTPALRPSSQPGASASASVQRGRPAGRGARVKIMSGSEDHDATDDEC